MNIPHFDWIAPIYSRFSYDATRLKELAQLPRRGDLLDIGGGSGRVVKALNGMVERCLIADASQGMLRQAKGEDYIFPIRTMAEQLPFPTDHFTIVLMVDAYHHLLNQQKALQEAWRVLRPGGILIVEEPDIRHPLVKIIALLEKALLMRSHFYSPPHIAKDLEKLGAKPHIYTVHYNAWIVAKKHPSETKNG